MRREVIKINITGDSLTKFRVQAQKLGLIHTDAPNVPLLLANIVAELKARPDAGSMDINSSECVKPPPQMRYEATLYEYYTEMIRDTVKTIRNSYRGAYVFSVEQIADTIKYEKRACFTYLPASDCFWVTLEDMKEADI